jgi:hypothetical protein
MQRPYAQRSDDQPSDLVSGQRALEVRPPCGVVSPPRKQHDDRARFEPPQSECERTRRSSVEPLNVVDGDQSRSELAQELKRVAHSDADCVAMDRITRGLLAEQRDLERSTPRHRERGQDDVDDPIEQIPESQVSKAALGLRRP